MTTMTTMTTMTPLTTVTTTAADTLPITLDAFTDECRVFFDATYPRRHEDRRPFVWGEGSDAVALFDESVDAEAGGEVDELGAVRRWRADLAAAGLAWIGGPAEFGGRGLPTVYQRAFDGVARQYDTPGNRKLMISLGMIAPTILTHGTPGAKQRYLRQLYDGSLIACQLFSEPGAGSDLASVSTKAVRDGDGWRITGQKVWTSGAHFADIGELLCRTSDDARHRNLTMFVVHMHAPGVDVRPLRQITGGAAFNEVFFDDVWIPDDDRLGEVGSGWRVALTTLGNERAAVGGDGFGGSGLLSQDRYIQMSRALGLSDDANVRQLLADLIVNLRVAKWNANRTADARRAGQTPGPEGSLGKLTLTDNYARIAHLVGVMLGPSLVADTGRWGSYAWHDFVVGLCGMRVGGGTDEVQKNIIAERVLGLPKN